MNTVTARTAGRALIIVALAFSLAGPAMAQRPPSDLTGNYLGRWNDRSEKGPGGRGVIGLEFFQVGAEGTFTGIATRRDDSEQLAFEGTYGVEGRRITGQVEIRIVGSDEVVVATVKGRCGKNLKRIRMKLTAPDGVRIKAKVRTFF